MFAHCQTSILIVVAMLMMCGSCLRCGQGREAEPVQTQPLTLLYTGCREVLTGPVCVLDKEAKLTVWIPSNTTDHVDITAGSGAAVHPGEWVDSGRRYEVEVGAAATELVATRSTAAGKEVFRLKLAHRAIPEPLVRAEQLKAQGELKQAQGAIEHAIASSPQEDIALYLSLLARLRLAQGDAEQAISLLRQAIRKHEASGRISQSIVDTHVLVHALVYNGRKFGEARAALAASGTLPAHCDSGYYRAYSRGSLSFEVDDLRGAADAFETSQRLAGRCGLSALVAMAQNEWALVLSAAGRWEEASQAFATVVDRFRNSASEVGLVTATTNLAWHEYFRHLVEPTRSFNIYAQLEATLELARALGAIGEAKISNLQVNLALAALLEGKVDLAARHLALARQAGLGRDPRLGLWAMDADAQIAASQGLSDDALSKYDQIVALSQSTTFAESELRGLIGRARIYQSRGENRLALLAYASAENLVSESALRVGLTDGRAAMLAARQVATREHLSLLVSLGRNEEALEVFRHARRRTLQGLMHGVTLSKLSQPAQAKWDQAVSEYLVVRERLAATAADDWQLPKERLAAVRAERVAQEQAAVRKFDAVQASLVRSGGQDPAFAEPKPGELLLAIGRGKDSWVAWAKTQEGILSADLGGDFSPLDPASMARVLEARLGDQLVAAKRIALLPDPALESADLHALVIAGTPLGLRAEVFYSLDLPASRSATALADDHRPALVVGDPEGDLPSARAEATKVAATLQGAGLSVQRLSGTEASFAALLSALPESSHFHYAGHAESMPQEGWGSALRLANGTRMQPADVLALSHGPRSVALLGCSTGVASSGPASTLGVAQAFVAAGAAEVIAASRPVSDQDAAALGESLYQNWKTGQGLGPAFVATSAAAAASGVDWAALRLYRPEL